MRLKHPKQGTVVEVSGALAERYRKRGWVDPSAPKRGRPRKQAAAKESAEEPSEED